MKDRKEKESEFKVITTHREARRDYFVIETYEVGIMLVGCEVKSLREGNTNLAGSFARLEGDELFLYNLYIAPYSMGNRENPDSRRNRKLLLHKSEIHKLKVKSLEKGLTLVPLRLYFNKRGMVKVELAVAKGKNLYDKRGDLKKQSSDREIDRAIKNRNR